MRQVSSPHASVSCSVVATSFGGIFDIDGMRRQVEALTRRGADPELWQDRGQAEALQRQRAAIQREVDLFDRLHDELEEVHVLHELAEEEGDASALREVAERTLAAEGAVVDAETRRLLGGEHDRSDAILSINAGAGGNDACDWAEMLLRMYLRYAERHGFRSDSVDLQEGEEAGIRSATCTLRGDYAYGQLQVEGGVHRLVRISPFDTQKRRHTAFASVAVVPEIDDSIEVEIEEKDLRVDTYRASGAGGQHVNKTESAVRITHLPTGIVVQCQNERSQHKNRARAIKVLRARLYHRARQEQEQRAAVLRGEKKDIGFGSQIRSYTLHPAQRIVDHRTRVEIGNVHAVLDGALDELIRAALLRRAAAGRA